MSTTATHRPLVADMRFRWRGIDADGVRKNGTLIAPDAGTARVMLKRENLFIVELAARGPAPRPSARAADVTLFTRQLASLLRAGLPLAPALDLLAQAQSSNRQGMPRIVGAVARDITGGLRFSAALQRHPAQFNALYCQLVEVGEAAGALAAVLARIADDRERAAAQRAKVRESARGTDLPVRDSVAGNRDYRGIAGMGRADLQTDLRWIRREAARADAIRAGAIVWRGALEHPDVRHVLRIEFGCDVSAAAFRSGAHPVRASIAKNAGCRAAAGHAGAVRSAHYCRPARR